MGKFRLQLRCILSKENHDLVDHVTTHTGGLVIIQFEINWNPGNAEVNEYFFALISVALGLYQR